MGRAKRIRKERAARRRAKRAERQRIDRLICDAMREDLEALGEVTRRAHRILVGSTAEFDQFAALLRDAFAALRDAWLIHGTPAQKRAIVRWRNRRALGGRPRSDG